MTYSLTWQNLQILFTGCTIEEKQKNILEQLGDTLTVLLPAMRAMLSTEQEGMQSQTQTPNGITRGGLWI